MMSKDNNTVLMIMAHGSRKIEANQEFEQLTHRIAKQSHHYAEVKPCFLDKLVPVTTRIKSSLELFSIFFNNGLKKP